MVEGVDQFHGLFAGFGFNGFAETGWRDRPGQNAVFMHVAWGCPTQRLTGAGTGDND